MKLILSIVFLVLVGAPSLSFAQTPTCPTITSYLTTGTRSAQVIALKKYLASQSLLDFSKNNTELFGTITKNAVKEWQAKNMGGVSYEKGAVDGPTRSALKKCNTVRPIQKGRACQLADTVVAHSASVTAYQSPESKNCFTEKRTCVDGKLSGSFGFAHCGFIKEKKATGNDVASFFIFDEPQLHKMQHLNLGAKVVVDAPDGTAFYKITHLPQDTSVLREINFVGMLTHERNTAGVDDNGRRTYTREQYEIPVGTLNMDRFEWSSNMEWLLATYISLPADIFPSFKDSARCSASQTGTCESVRPYEYRWVKNWELKKGNSTPQYLGTWNATPTSYALSSSVSNTASPVTFIGKAWYYPVWGNAVLKKYIDTQLYTYPEGKKYVRPSEGITERMRAVREALIVRHYGQCDGQDTVSPDTECRVFEDHVYGKDEARHPLGEIAIFQGVTPRLDNWKGIVKEGHPGYWALGRISVSVDD